MLGQDVVNEINRKLNGEFEVVEFESDDWNSIVSAVNENIDLYNKSGKWVTSYDPNYSIGTVGYSQFYTLNYSEINEINNSNRAYIAFYNSDGEKVDEYKLVQQDMFDISGSNDKVATINMNGLQIKPKTSTDTIYDCTIVLPVFRKVKKLTRTTDNIIMDDIYWLIVKTASDMAATSPVNFISRNYEPFAKDAERRMAAMKKSNRTIQSSTPAYGGWIPSTRPDGR